MEDDPEITGKPLIINDPRQLQLIANRFVELIYKVMDNPNAEHPLFDGLIRAYRLMTETFPGETFMVHNDPEVNIDFGELLVFTTEKDLHVCMQDPMHISREMISFATQKKSAESFLRVLCHQVMINPPTGHEELKKHVIRNIASVFNGSNRFGLTFELRFTDYLSSFEDIVVETTDISPYLVV